MAKTFKIRIVPKLPLIVTWRLLICTSISTVLVDVVLASLYNTILTAFPSQLIIPIYVTVSLLSIAVFFSILILARINPLEVKGAFIKISQKTAWIIQFIITILVLFLLIEILTDSEFTQAIASYSQIFGLLGASFMLLILLRQLIYTYKRYRSHLLLLYSIAIVSTISYFVVVASLNYFIISDKPSTVNQRWLNTHVYLPSNSVERQIAQFVSEFQDASFLMLWIASGYLFRYQFKRRSIAFMLLLSTPVIYFLGRIVDIRYLVSIFDGDIILQSIVSIVTDSVSPLIGGLIFGLAFYYTSRSLPLNSKLKTYLNITGHGIVILLASSHYDTILQYPYPPFGMIAMSSAYMGGYLLLLGIYSTALSSAQNIRIHNEIAKIVQETSKLSHEMGTAIFVDNIEKQVFKIERRLEEESGVESTPDEIDIREYIEELIEEKKKASSNRK